MKGLNKDSRIKWLKTTCRLLARDSRRKQEIIQMVDMDNIYIYQNLIELLQKDAKTFMSTRQEVFLLKGIIVGLLNYLPEDVSKEFTDDFLNKYSKETLQKIEDWLINETSEREVNDNDL